MRAKPPPSPPPPFPVRAEGIRKIWSGEGGTGWVGWPTPAPPALSDVSFAAACCCFCLLLASFLSSQGFSCIRPGRGTVGDRPRPPSLGFPNCFLSCLTILLYEPWPRGTRRAPVGRALPPPPPRAGRPEDGPPPPRPPLPLFHPLRTSGARVALENRPGRAAPLRPSAPILPPRNSLCPSGAPPRSAAPVTAARSVWPAEGEEP